MKKRKGLRAPRLGRALIARGASPAMRVWLTAEYLLLFFAGPLFFYFTPYRRVIIPTLLVAGTVCMIVLWRDKTFDRRRLWNWGEVRARLPKVLVRFVVLASLIAAAVAIFEPREFLGFPRSNPGFWAVVMLAYPLFSVYPQELIFRAFLFHRYGSVFRNGWAMIAASALAFGFGHIVLNNWVAVAMTVIGGALFARTYQRTRSVLAASLEHALYGDLVFTLGLGMYFYAGHGA